MDLCGLRVVFAKGYKQFLFPFRDSEGKEKQSSEREIDCGSTGALAFRRGRISSLLACLLLQGDSWVSKPDLNITS